MPFFSLESGSTKFLGKTKEVTPHKQAMITLHGMAENRLTSVYFFTNVFLGEIFFTP